MPWVMLASSGCAKLRWVVLVAALADAHSVDVRLDFVTSGWVYALSLCSVH